MAKATAAKRAKKPRPPTKAQLALVRDEAIEDKPKHVYGIDTVLVGEHMNCPVPVHRNDLYVGQESFEQPFMWGRLTFELVERTGKLHTYQEVRYEP